MKLTLLTCCLLFSASCALPRVKSVYSETRKPPTAVETPLAQPETRATEKISEPRLYARDGTPVSPQEVGTIEVASQSGRAFDTEEGSRWTLLEKYQEAVAARDNYEIEVEALGMALDQAALAATSARQAKAELLRQVSDLQQRVVALEGENIELAGRLTTAQVRRLQSEKLLLEAKLDWSRIQATLNKPAQASPESTA
ncbi:MAG: hypothetical protein ABGY71_08735, partial [bacterium]